jgi:hypothetical protein
MAAPRRRQGWTSVFGWDDAVGSLSAALMPPPPPLARGQAKAKAKAQPKAQGKAEARAKAVAQPLRTASRFVDRLRFDKDGYAEVKSLLQVVPTANDTKSSYWSTKIKGRHCYNDDQIFQRQRTLQGSRPGQKRKREGGSEGWVATREVLEQICIDMRVADVP